MYDEKNHRFLSLSSLYSYYTGAIDDGSDQWIGR